MQALEETEISYFSPKDEVLVNTNSTEEEQKKAEELAQEQEKKAVEEEKIKIQEMLKKDPFYRFRKMKEAEANDRTN